MSTEDELKEIIGDPVSGRGPRPISQAFPIASTDPSDKMRAVEADPRKVYEGLNFLARQIDDLRSQIVGS
jgi:hypothetical protein